MKKMVFILILIAVAGGLIGVFLFATPIGSKILVRKALDTYLHPQEQHVEEVEGSIFGGITIENLELKDIKGLPENSILRIQKLVISSTSFRIQEFTVEIDNARLRIQSSDPIILNGSLKSGVLDFNLFGPGFGINEVKDFLFVPAWLKAYSGTIENIDVLIKGTLDEPTLEGEIFVERLDKKNLSLVKVPLIANIQLKKKGSQWEVFGQVKTDRGRLYSRRTAVHLKESAVTFSGSPKDFALDLKGESTIDNVHIQIRITGTKLKPEIVLNSQPPLPRQALLVMLATGKRWDAVESAIIGEQLSPEIASDFIDYFLFDGQGQAIARKFGIKDINITLTGNKQGIGIKKEVTSKMDVGYGVEKTNATVTEGVKTKQTIEGAYKLTEKVSVEMEKKIESEQKTNALENEPNEVKSEDKVLLKYEKKF